MKNYKSTISRIDSIISKRDKSLPVSTSGLLAPKMKQPTRSANSIDEQLADYIAMIRKQRQELVGQRKEKKK
jgi:hypothetical protein